jgi:hypothetical protein
MPSTWMQHTHLYTFRCPHVATIRWRHAGNTCYTCMDVACSFTPCHLPSNINRQLRSQSLTERKSFSKPWSKKQNVSCTKSCYLCHQVACTNRDYWLREVVQRLTSINEKWRTYVYIMPLDIFPFRLNTKKSWRHKRVRISNTINSLQCCNTRRLRSHWSVITKRECYIILMSHAWYRCFKLKVVCWNPCTEIFGYATQ